MGDLCDVCWRPDADSLGDDCTCPKCRVCGESIARWDPGWAEGRHQDCWDDCWDDASEDYDDA